MHTFKEMLKNRGFTQPLMSWQHWMLEKKKHCPQPVVCILFMSVTYSTDTDIKTHCDVSMRLVSGPLFGREPHMCRAKKQTKLRIFR